MASGDLADFKARLGVKLGIMGFLLIDADGTELIRTALNRVNVESGTALTINGLDSATTTTLPALDWETILEIAENEFIVGKVYGYSEDTPYITPIENLEAKLKLGEEGIKIRLEKIRKRYLQENETEVVGTWEFGEENIEFTI